MVSHTNYSRCDNLLFLVKRLYFDDDIQWGEEASEVAAYSHFVY